MGNPDRITCKQGQILLEVMALLMITSFVSLSGFHLAGRILAGLEDQIEKERDYLYYQQLTDAFQNAFDSRYINPFSEEPWLVLDTDPGEKWFRLNSLKITIINDANPRLWEWENPWNETIFINHGKMNYESHQRPKGIQIRFPDSILPHFREGIAIEGIW